MIQQTLAPSRLQLRLHGYPGIRIDGRPVPLNLKYGLALVAYLAEQARPVGRDALAALLWPEAQPGLGRGRLRRLMHELHTRLGVALVGGHADALWLAAGVDSDLARTRAAIARAGAADIEALARASACELLAGFSLDSDAFEDWLAACRRTQRSALLRALERGVERALSSDDADAAACGADVLLCADACSERGHAARLHAHALRGDLAALEAAYFDAARVWRNELGRGPSARIEAAYAAASALLQPVALAA